LTNSPQLERVKSDSVGADIRDVFERK